MENEYKAGQAGLYRKFSVTGPTPGDGQSVLFVPAQDIEDELAQLSAALALAQAERDACRTDCERLSIEKDSLVVSWHNAELREGNLRGELADIRQYSAALTVLLGTVQAERDAATRRAEQAEAVAARLRKQREELHEFILTCADGEWNNGEDDRAGALRDLVNGAIKRGLLDAAALAGPEGGPR